MSQRAAVTASEAALRKEVPRSALQPVFQDSSESSVTAEDVASQVALSGGVLGQECLV